MNKTVTIYCKNTASYHDFPIGTSLLEISNQLQIKLKYDIVAARVNYKVEDLNFLVYKPKDIEFIDASCPSGMRVYVRTLSMVFAYAVKRLFPEAILSINHSISKGYYCRLDYLSCPLNQEVIDRIKSEINKIITEAYPIIVEEKQVKEVKKLFAMQNNQHENLSLFETINTPYMRYFRIHDYVD